MIKRNYIFESCITIDGKFLIFQDNVFSLNENKNLGNIWESIDIFKILFNNVNINNSSFSIIKESLNKIPILENNTNLFKLRDILLEFNFLQDTWLGREFGKSAKGIKDFAIKSYDGLKKFGIAISQGQWDDILNILSKGAVYILRSLKSALFSTGGMIVDSMLIAMLPLGTGKVAQFVPWALVFGLDVYQWVNNDYEEETTTLTKVLDISFDIIGMLSSGLMAKQMKMLFEPLKRIGKNEIAKNKKMKGFITTILNGLNKVPGYFTNVIKLFDGKFKPISDFLKSILGKIKSVLNTIKNTFELLLGVKPTKVVGAGTKTGTTLYGVEKGINKIKDNNNIEQNLINKLKTNKTKAEFDINDI